MKKKYQIPEPDPEKHMLNESAIEYGTNSSLSAPCQYSVEELRENFDKAIEQVKKGEYYNEDELDDFILS